MSRTYWIIAIGLTLAAWAVAAWYYPTLPDRIPTHWNISGKVDGWGDKTWATFLTPMMMVVFLGMFAILPSLSPRHFEVDTFRSTYLYIMVLITALFFYMNVVILMATWQSIQEGPKTFDIGRALIGGIFLFFALLGNVMGKVRKNFYIGIRVPWTLASDRVWNDTHRLAAWVMVAVGILGFLLVIAGVHPLVAVGLLLGSMLIPVVYSFVHYKALERSGGLEADHRA
jgi:uncharacterized membrane protein